jgi:hypothetical protein
MSLDEFFSDMSSVESRPAPLCIVVVYVNTCFILGVVDVLVSQRGLLGNQLISPMAAHSVK